MRLLEPVAEDLTAWRTVIDVAGQAGHSPETCLRYSAHLFAEFDSGCA